MMRFWLNWKARQREEEITLQEWRGQSAVANAEGHRMNAYDRLTRRTILTRIGLLHDTAKWPPRAA
jgi:hypothetical protein